MYFNLCIIFYYICNANRERCQSDRMDRTRNPAYAFLCTVGLNPTLSAPISNDSTPSSLEGAVITYWCKDARGSVGLCVANPTRC